MTRKTHPRNNFLSQVQQERDDLYNKFVSAIHEVQQKAGFKNLLLEKKLLALADVLEKKEAQLNEVQVHGVVVLYCGGWRRTRKLWNYEHFSACASHRLT